MASACLHLLENPIQRYPWGSPTAIPELLCVEPDGAPQAELWMGAHPSAPSRVLTGEGALPLDAWIARSPEEILGSAVAERFGAELPFLLKILAAERPLSIQAHPDAETARAGFARENAAGIPLDAPHRNYRDPHPKPELICALSRFEALCGFRELAEIRECFERLECPALAEESAPLLADSAGPQELAGFFAALLRLDDARRDEVLASARRCAAASPGDAAWRWVAALVELHPDDIGALAPLLLNHVILEPGQALELRAGELHSYLGGLGVEIMASSDNVLRGGLTSKHIDVDELLSVLTWATGPVDVLAPRDCGGGELRYETRADEFALSVLRVASAAPPRSPARRTVELLLWTEGAGRISAGDGDELRCSPGATVLVPAAAPRYRIEGEGVIYRASVPQPGTAGKVGTP